MPILEYECFGCGTRYEIFHFTREKEEDIICPGCNSTKYKKLMSVPSINSRIKSESSNNAPACKYANTSMCHGNCDLMD
jgi:putative FmdB family regulatory protein